MKRSCIRCSIPCHIFYRATHVQRHHCLRARCVLFTLAVLCARTSFSACCLVLVVTPSLSWMVRCLCQNAATFSRNRQPEWTECPVSRQCNSVRGIVDVPPFSTSSSLSRVVFQSTAMPLLLLLFSPLTSCQAWATQQSTVIRSMGHVEQCIHEPWRRITNSRKRRRLVLQQFVLGRGKSRSFIIKTQAICAIITRKLSLFKITTVFLCCNCRVLNLVSTHFRVFCFSSVPCPLVVAMVFHVGNNWTHSFLVRKLECFKHVLW